MNCRLIVVGVEVAGVSESTPKEALAVVEVASQSCSADFAGRPWAPLFSSVEKSPVLL